MAGREEDGLADVYGKPLFPGDRAGRRAQALLHPVQAGYIGVAKVHREHRFSGHDVARVGPVDDHADGAARMLGGLGEPVDFLDQKACAVERIAAQMHGCGAGVRVHAAHRDLEPALTERTGHHAYGIAGVFQQRSLLDVRLEIGTQLAPAHRRGARVADGAQRVAERHTVEIRRG